MRVNRRMISAAVVCLLSCFMFVFGTVRAIAYVTVAAEIPVTCLAISDDTAHIYEIRIESENAHSPAPVSDILKITENGTGYFEIPLTEPGTFRYRIYEAAGNDPTVQYDSKLYDVTVFAENDTEDGLKYTVTAHIVGRNTKPEGIEFRDIVLSETDIAATSARTEITSSRTETMFSMTTSTAIAEATTKPSKNHPKPLTEFMENVLTGDSFPAHTVRIVMVSSFLIAISTLLFKRKHSEEEDENEK